jgi:hypothetical protein
MNSRYLVIILLILLIAPVAAFDIFEEKPKTQWGFRDFYTAAQKAGDSYDYYKTGLGNDPVKAAEADQSSLEYYLKAEELVAKDPDNSPDKWYFMNKIESEKFQIYQHQGKIAEAEKASAAMAVYNQKYVALTKDDTSFDLGCLIATATFDSPLAPQVQQLREFRENNIYSTKSGTQFMTAFNVWYYSFSPTVANFINDHPVIKAPMRVILTPLLGILTLAKMSFSALSFNPDIAVIVSGLVASTLIGVVYAFPVLLVLLLVIRKIHPFRFTTGVLKIFGGSAITGLVLLAVGGLLSVKPVLLVGSVLFVVSLVFLTGLFLSWVCINRLDLRSAYVDTV